MQALKLEAAWGLRWVSKGWRMFRKQPLGFMATLFMFWLMLLAASALIGLAGTAVSAAAPSLSTDLVEAIGSLLFAALTPALTVGFLQACRVAELDLPVHPFLIFAPLRAGRETRRRLFGLGLIQVLAVTAIVLATSGTAAFRSGDPPPSTPRAGAATAPTNPPKATDAQRPADPAIDEAQVRARAAELTIEGLSYLPVALVMWYAPMLVAWHGIPVGKSIFFSVVGVWRNRAAFLVYGVAWVVIWMVASVLLAIVSAVTGAGNAAIVVVAPLAMLLLTCMYCSMYQSYATVYVETPPAPVS